MRALVLADFWKLTVDDVPDPSPGPGDVLIEVVATGICGSDIHGYTGENGRRVRGQVMGHETVGRIAREKAFDGFSQYGRVDPLRAPPRLAHHFEGGRCRGGRRERRDRLGFGSARRARP